jgi:serine/threonine-protein kinase RsbT
MSVPEKPERLARTLSGMGNEALLTQEFEICGGNIGKAGDVSMQIKSMLKAVGFPSEIIRRAAIACYEAEMNVVMYARFARLKISITPSRINVEFNDEGEGIEDIELAMQEGYSTASDFYREMGFGAGMGLPNIKKNTDEMEIRSVKHQGTYLRFGIDVKK